MSEEKRLPLPPFDEKSAKQKVRMAENGWNVKDPQKISLAYSANSQWRNSHFFKSQIFQRTLGIYRKQNSRTIC